MFRVALDQCAPPKENSVDLRPASIFLDEAGHIYLPLLGPSQSCLRLNRSGSILWRRWTSSPFDPTTLPPLERQLLDQLLAAGALREITADDRTATVDPVGDAIEAGP
jgi:hypothetical protein